MGSWPALVRPPCGAGLRRMQSAPGPIVVGSFRVIPLSRRRPAESSISMRVIGKANACDADFVISTDEKTSIQARRRRHPTLAPAPHRQMRVEHEYVRRGAWAYLAAWDVHRAKIHGRCERTTGIAPFTRLVHKSCVRSPTVRHAASSGSWTTVPRIAASRASTEIPGQRTKFPSCRRSLRKPARWRSSHSLSC